MKKVGKSSSVTDVTKYVKEAIKAHITKIHTKKRETEKRKERYQVGGLGGSVRSAQGMADQRQAAASCQGQ